MKKVPLKIAVVLALAALGRGAQAQDVMSIPASTGGLGPNPTTVTIPISITDNAGTALNETNPDATKIRGINVKVNYSPAAAVTSATITVPAPTAGNPCSNASGQLKTDGSSVGSVRTSVVWPTVALGPVFTVGSSVPCLALTLNFAANFPPGGVTVSIDPDPAFTSLANSTGATNECVTGANCAGGGLTLSAAGTITPVHLTKFSAE